MRPGSAAGIYSIRPLALLDGRRRSLSVTIRTMRRDFHIDKLSDEFGQYSLEIAGGACGHKRTADPYTLGKLCGWRTAFRIRAPDLFACRASITKTLSLLHAVRQGGA